MPRYLTLGNFLTFIGLIFLSCKMWILIVYTTGAVNGIGEGDVGQRKLIHRFSLYFSLGVTVILSGFTSVGNYQ